MEPEPLDPRWEWSEMRTLCSAEPTYIRVRCRHLGVVPVESGGEVVAGLCLTCDAQLSPHQVTRRSEPEPPHEYVLDAPDGGLAFPTLDALKGYVAEQGWTDYTYTPRWYGLIAD